MIVIRRDERRLKNDAQSFQELKEQLVAICYYIFKLVDDDQLIRNYVF